MRGSPTFPARTLIAAAVLLSLAQLLVACRRESHSGDRAHAPSPTPVTAPTACPTGAPAATPTAARSDGRTPPPEEPRGFPIDPQTKLGIVVGEGGGRGVDWDADPKAEVYSLVDQPSNDGGRANGSGWNCRVHVEYEGQPAVDWYVPVGTPILATMPGTATLHVITVTNAFDYYGVSREPYLGYPDRERAPVSPFPGPGGGKGVFVRIEHEGLATEYAHLDLALTAPAIPPEAFLSECGPDSDYDRTFAAIRGFRESTPIARWVVKQGDVIGLSGDAGYSEAPHLHYTVSRDGVPLCPTEEDGFADGGWLAR